MVNRKIVIAVGALVVAGVAALGAIAAYPASVIPKVGMAVNYVRSWWSPSGTTNTETATASADMKPAALTATPPPTLVGTTDDWPSYNRTLRSQRYSPLAQITREN